MLDMRGNVVAGIIVVTVGAVFVRSLKPVSSKATPRLWIPVVAFISAPVIAFTWCIVEACYISPGSFTQPGDVAETAVPVVIIGVVAGMIGGTVFWLAER